MKNQTLNILNHMPLREGMVIHNIKYIALRHIIFIGAYNEEQVLHH